MRYGALSLLVRRRGKFGSGKQRFGSVPSPDDRQPSGNLRLIRTGRHEAEAVWKRDELKCVSVPVLVYGAREG